MHKKRAYNKNANLRKIIELHADAEKFYIFS